MIRKALLASLVTVAFAGTGESDLGLATPENSSDVFNALGPTVFGTSPVGHALEILLILLIPAGLTQTFGIMVGNSRQGWTILGVRR